MKIEYRAASTGSGVDYAVLADESVPALAARISGYQPKLNTSPDVQQGIGRSGVAVFDRGNDRWTLEFLVERSHATPDDAVTYISTHAAIFSPLGNLDIRITQGGKVTFMPNCALTGFVPDPSSDCSTRCRYAFTGGKYTTTAP